MNINKLFNSQTIIDFSNFDLCSFNATNFILIMICLRVLAYTTKKAIKKHTLNKSLGVLFDTYLIYITSYFMGTINHLTIIYFISYIIYLILIKFVIIIILKLIIKVLNLIKKINIKICYTMSVAGMLIPVPTTPLLNYSGVRR
jgi:hypothetical protein